MPRAGARWARSCCLRREFLCWERYARSRSSSSLTCVDQAREDSRWVVHTVEVENQIPTVLLQIRRAESAVRGYLLTSQPQFLGEYETAAASIAPGLDKLLGLTGDNPVQSERGHRLRSAVESRL